MTVEEFSRPATVRPPREVIGDAVCAALKPHRWRGLTPEFLARLVLAVVDRHRVRALLVTVPEAWVGTWDELEPVPLDDDRVELIVRFLRTRRWSHLTLKALSAQLVAVVPGI